jgi:hypothetical protein
MRSEKNFNWGKKRSGHVKLVEEGSSAVALPSRKEIIISRRGAFKWLPVLCSNDLVHGSWYVICRYIYNKVYLILFNDGKLGGLFGDL